MGLLQIENSTDLIEAYRKLIEAALKESGITRKGAQCC
jgi:hypothetical protein